MTSERLTQEKVNNLLIETVGEDSIEVVNFLKKNKNISEFKIAEQLKIEIHIVRNILYRLHDKHLATYKRKKDKKKGWYISYWNFNPPRVKELIEQVKAEKLDRFKSRLDKELAHQGNFFMCANRCVRMDFDNAVESEFKCPECGELMLQQDNNRTIEHLQAEIGKLEKSLKRAS